MPTKIIKTPLTESKFKQKIYKVLDWNFMGHYRRKFAGQWTAGCLDLLIIYKSISVWLELKVYPNKLTALQLQEIKKINIAGGNAYALTAYPDHYALGILALMANGEPYIKEVEYRDLGTLLKEVLL